MVSTLLVELESAQRAVALVSTGPKPTATTRKSPGIEDAEDAVVKILEALNGHADARIVAVARTLLAPYGLPAATILLTYGSVDDVRAVADALGGKDYKMFDIAVRATLMLPSSEVDERFKRVFFAADRAKAIGRWRLDSLAPRFAPSGEAWIDVLLEATALQPFASQAVTFLGATKSPRAFEPLAAMFAAAEKQHQRDTLLEALFRISGERARKLALAQLASHPENFAFHRLREMFLEVADVADVDAVRRVIANVSVQEKWHAQWLLASLESKFPGA